MELDFNRDWLLMKEDGSSCHVNLPHDAMIHEQRSFSNRNGDKTGFFPGGKYVYKKEFSLDSRSSDEQIIIHFNGVYGRTKLLLNGQNVGNHLYGYTPFDVDITDASVDGQNVLEVIVDNTLVPNTRWYSGSGIYRMVTLIRRDRTHIDDVRINTVCINPPTIHVSCNMKNANVIIIDADGKIVAEGPLGDLVIENANLWSSKTPYLYTCQISTESEYVEKKFGIRELKWSSEKGLTINGPVEKLRGGCIHHDNGILGAASFYDAEYRKVKLHKDNGYNALRLAHNPQSEQILDICDELGMIVFDEAFDVWNLPKNSFDFSHQFAEDGIKEIEAMVRRDRNHPSIFFWSIGNELTEQGGMAAGYEVSAMLVKTVRNMDSTRLVSGALCSFFKGLDNEDNAAFWQTFRKEMPQGGSVINMDNSYGKKIWMEYTAPFVKDWDVVGYNYLNYHYETSHELFPDRVILCTESKPGQFEDYWSDVERLPYVIGDFLWTSMDYIGEAGIGKSIYCSEEEVPQMSRMLNYAAYPWRLAQAGDFDLCGNVRAQGRYHQIIWGANDTYIFAKDPKNNGKIALIGRYGWAEGGNHWSWNCENGTAVSVDVYSRAEEVELLLNGKSLGKKPAGAECHFKAEFEVTYEAGTLTAISYQDGQEVSRDEVKTVGEPVGLKITMEKNQIAADGESLAYGIVEIVDAEGNWVPTAEDTLAKVSVEGAASLAGFGTGRGQTEENYTKGEFTSFEGRWQVILRAGTEAGEAGVHVEAEGLGHAESRVIVG